MWTCKQTIIYFSKLGIKIMSRTQTDYKSIGSRWVINSRYSTDKQFTKSSSFRKHNPNSEKSSIPPKCEEICGKVPAANCHNPSDKFSNNLTKYWKQILAALLIAGVTSYAFNEYSNANSGKTRLKKKKEVKDINKINREEVRIPATSLTIPSDVPYLLIGGGTAAFSAFRSIKSKDPKAKVLVLNAETEFPYMRPPLSKELWYSHDRVSNSELKFKQWNGTTRSLFYEPKEFYSTVENLMSSDKGGIAVASGWKVKGIDPYNKIAILEDGYEIKYGKCLIATGAKPKNLKIFESATDEVKNKIIIFRTKNNFLELEERVHDPNVKNIVIVGGGFLGSELACALAKKLENSKKNVYQVYKEKFIMNQILPEYLSAWTTKRSMDEGVISIGNEEVLNLEHNDHQLKLVLTSGKLLNVDQIIVAIGCNANTEIALASELEIEPQIGGFIVNAELEARRDLWVAGDAACFYDVKLGRRRIEHHDHAVISGRLAGENMTGAGKPYLHQSMFWSDLGPDVGYEAIGIIDSTLPTVGIFAKSENLVDKVNEDDNISEIGHSNHKRNIDESSLVSQNHLIKDHNNNEDDLSKGIIFYLRNNIVVGIILWNIFNRISTARQVLARGTHRDEVSEVAKLFAIHED